VAPAGRSPAPPADRIAPSWDRPRGEPALPVASRHEGRTVVAATSEHGAVVVRARELVEFARRHGYRRDDLIEIIETLG
jgi:hypothetical protein